MTIHRLRQQGWFLLRGEGQDSPSLHQLLGLDDIIKNRYPLPLMAHLVLLAVFAWPWKLRMLFTLSRRRSPLPYPPDTRPRSPIRSGSECLRQRRGRGPASEVCWRPEVSRNLLCKRFWLLSLEKDVRACQTGSRQKASQRFLRASSILC